VINCFVVAVENYAYYIGPLDVKEEPPGLSFEIFRSYSA